MKSKLIVAICLLLASIATTAAQETRIAAVINDEVVTGDDVNARLILMMRSSGLPDTPENRKKLTPRIINQLIDEHLQMQEAKRLNITVPKEDVDAALARLEQQNNMPKGGLDKYLADNGISRSSLVAQITASLAWEKVVSNRLLQDVTVSDDEIAEAMARLKANVGKPESRVAEIFLAIDNPSQQDEVKRLADKLIEQVRGGANFAAVAQQFSQSPTAAVGGDIGWIAPDELSPLLGEAVSKMNPGEMSYPIHTTAGYYILYLIDRQTLGATTPDQIHLSLVEVVFPLSPTATPDERQHVEAQAQNISNTAKSCGEMAKLGQERAPELSRQVPDVKASDLPADEQKELLALKLAEPSKPMPIRGGIGVVMVCQKKEPPGLPTADQLRESLGHQRLDALAKRYLSDLRRGAYLDIRA
jgi:peptidyl-prolyl cis-trans isomerase SurA